MGFLLRAGLCFPQRALAIRLESCSPSGAIVPGPFPSVLLRPLQLGLPPLEAPLRLTLQPSPCFAHCVLELPTHPAPPLPGLSHGALALGRPARPTLIGLSDTALPYLGLGPGVFGFPTCSPLLGFAQGARMRIALGPLALGHPAVATLLGFARQSLVFGLPARPPLARLPLQPLRRRLLGALVLGVPAHAALVSRAGTPLLADLPLPRLERLEPFEPVGSVAVRRRAVAARHGAIGQRLDTVSDRDRRQVPARRPRRVLHTFCVLRPLDLRQRDATGSGPGLGE